MPETDSMPSREQLIEMIGNASLSGYLGLFVGTGFSKAATADAAPSFNELIRKLIRRLGLSINIDSDEVCRHRSLPQIASMLVEELTRRVPDEPASERLKEEVAHLCNLIPEPSLREDLSDALRRLRPSWVITTNYDLILESLLDESTSVLPNQPLVARPDRVPVYHLHGHRLNPTAIKITEEDYVGLLGPIDYQRLKLPLILLESTTVMLGYSLGDINVRAAMEWSRSFRGSQGINLSSGQGVVIQALYKPSGLPLAPYEGPNGEHILEIDDVVAFLRELANHRERLEISLRNVRDSIEDFLSDPETAEAVANEGSERASFLGIIKSALPFAQATRFIDFLNRALDPIWERAREDGGFAYYDTYLGLLLDILSRIEVGQCNPALMSYLADALDRVGWYIDPIKSAGSAWAATDTWSEEHHKISDNLKSELYSYARANDRTGLKRMLRQVLPADSRTLAISTTPPF